MNENRAWAIIEAIKGLISEATSEDDRCGSEMDLFHALVHSNEPYAYCRCGHNDVLHAKDEKGWLRCMSTAQHGNARVACECKQFEMDAKR